jgi:AcrR family transcriptional regulator
MEAARKPAGRTPRGQGELLRERLIDAALAILDEGHEPSAISIRGVTKKAGVSPTAFYLHFEDRQELMRALIERGFTEFRRQINEGADRGSDPEGRLVGAGSAYLSFSREQPERYRLIFAADWDEHGISDEPEDKLEVADAAFEDLVSLITDYLGSDGRDPAELDTIALGIWSGLHGYATLCHAQPGMAALTDEQYALLLAGAWLGPPPGR